jgi:TetR/AcrR family transcriptional regulator, cholesterol catabolism regulator
MAARMVTQDAPVPVRIRQAALGLFAARGFDATGIREIAEAASIPTSLLYHYRRSKEEILRELIIEGLSRHLESSRRAVLLAGTPEESLRAMVGVHVLVPLRNPEMARVMESEVRALSRESQEVVRGRRAEGDRRWESVLAPGIEAGVFTVPDLRLGRRLLLRLCTGVAHWYTPDAGITVDELLERMFDHALGLVRARRGDRLVRAAEVARPGTAELQEIVDAVHAEDPAER